MGYRTVVILFNDQASEWKKDPELGKKIAAGMNFAMGSDGEELHTPADLRYGRVVECAHADQQTLAVIDSYSFKPIAHSNWYAKELPEDVEIKLLCAAARKHGYRLSKIPAKEQQ